MKKSVAISFVFMLLSTFSCKTTQDKPCIDESKIKPDQICTMQYEPVCGCDGKTYGNACEAEKAGVTAYTKGECNSN